MRIFTKNTPDTDMEWRFPYVKMTAFGKTVLWTFVTPASARYSVSRHRQVQVTCLLRELKEEIGLTEGDVVALRFLGFLYSEGSDVDSVHLGLVYEMETLRTDVICLETDK